MGAENAPHHGAVHMSRVRGCTEGSAGSGAMAEGSASSTAGLSTALPWEKNGKSGRRSLPLPGLRPPSSESESAGVKVTASASEVSRAAVMVRASARKKLPVTPVTAMRGRKTTTGVMVEPTSGVAISCSAMRMALSATGPRRDARRCFRLRRWRRR